MHVGVCYHVFGCICSCNRTIITCSGSSSFCWMWKACNSHCSCSHIQGAETSWPSTEGWEAQDIDRVHVPPDRFAYYSMQKWARGGGWRSRWGRVKRAGLNLLVRISLWTWQHRPVMWTEPWLSHRLRLGRRQLNLRDMEYFSFFLKHFFLIYFTNHSFLFFFSSCALPYFLSAPPSPLLHWDLKIQTTSFSDSSVSFKSFQYNNFKEM